MAYQSKFKGAEIDELLGKVQDGTVLETYTEDGTTSASIEAETINLKASKVLVNDDQVATETDLAKKQDTLTAGDSIKIENNVVSIDPTSTFFQNLVKAEVDTFLLAGGGDATNIMALMQSAGLGNLYVKLVNSDEGETVCTINGESVTLSAGQTYSGYVDSFTEVTLPHYLKKVYIIGNSDVVFGDEDTTENTTLEEVQMYFTSDVARTDKPYLLRAQRVLRSIVVSNLNASNFNRGFSGCYALESLTLINPDTSRCGNMQFLVSSAYPMTYLDLSMMDVGYSTSSSYTCQDCTSLKVANISGWKPAINRSSTGVHYFFDGCTALEKVYMTDCDFAKTTQFNRMFNNCSALTDIVGPISNVKYNIDASACPLTRESALVLINGLSDEPSEESPTLSLSSTTKGYLTDDDIAIATDKGWTIA